MPGFDGTGPEGQGPLTGRGEGHCVIKLSDSDQAPRGYAGIQGTPVMQNAPPAQPGPVARFRRWPATRWLWRVIGRGRGAARSSDR